MMLQERYRKQVDKVKELKSTLKQKEFDIVQLNDLNAGLQTENKELEAALKKLHDKLQKGASYIVVKDGYVVEGGILPPEAIILYPTQIEVNDVEISKGYCEFIDNKVRANTHKKNQYLKTFEGGIK